MYVGALVHCALSCWPALSSKQKVQNTVNLDTKITVHHRIASDTPLTAPLWMEGHGNTRQTGAACGIFLNVAKRPKAIHSHKDKALRTRSPSTCSFPVYSSMLLNLVLQTDCTTLFCVHSVLFICCLWIHWWCYATSLIHCIDALSWWSCL